MDIAADNKTAFFVKINISEEKRLINPPVIIRGRCPEVFEKIAMGIVVKKVMMAGII
jgi:hypothetical protein